MQTSCVIRLRSKIIILHLTKQITGTFKKRTINDAPVVDGTNS